MQQAESPAMTTELSAMTWEALIQNHPDRRDEIRALWQELESTARRILADPDAHAELILRAQKRVLRTRAKP